MKSILNFLDRDFTLSKRQVIWIMLALVVIGLGLRLTYWTIRERPPRDEKVYIQTVENINNGDKDWQKKSGYMPPLMPYTASNVCKFGIAPETALHTLNMLYAMLWVWIMFFLCRDVFDNDKAGLLGMTIAAFNPYSIRMACQILREPLYILFFTLALWCAVKIIRQHCTNLLYPALLGMLTILGFYTRFEGAEIALFLPLAIVIILVQHKWQYFRRCTYSLAIYFFMLGLIVATLIKFENTYLVNTQKKMQGYYKLICKK
jgi:4-amino-4-deoxy-L-arabinose transferase-like glycosyltransferase